MHKKIEGNPRLLTCGYGVVFGRLEFVAKEKVGARGERRSWVGARMDGWMKDGWMDEGLKKGKPNMWCRHPRLTQHHHHHNHSHPQTPQGNYVPIDDLRAILLAPVSKFEALFPGYAVYLAQQLLNAEWAAVRGKTIHEVMRRGVKKLESDYGNCLRAVVNK